VIDSGSVASGRAFVPAASPVSDRHHRDGRLLLTRSEGTIGELAHLLTGAAIAAIESGEEAINRRTLLMAPYAGPPERWRLFERELA
jgi:hypothetical protein